MLNGFYVAQVRIQPSFTQLRRDDPAKPSPSGIDVAVELLDQFGDPIKAVGKFRFEIFRYQGAFNDVRGRRFEQNGIQEIDLTSADLNNKHWDRITRNYRFHLNVPELQTQQGRIVLQVTFTREHYRMQDSLVINRTAPKPTNKPDCTADDGIIKDL